MTIVNSRAAAPRANFRGNEMDAFDSLPAPVRRAMWEGVTEWSALEARRNINRAVRRGMSVDDAVAAEVAAIIAADKREVFQFAHHWPSRFGRYPHVAAKATIMRYRR